MSGRSITLPPRAASAAALAACAALAAACGVSPSALELARAAGEERDRPRAIGLYQRYLEERPDDFDVRLEYTLLLGEEWAYRGGDREPIVENLARLHAARPDNARVKELLGMMLVGQGQAALAARRFEEAEGRYLRAIDVNPDVGTPSYHLGVLYEEWGRPDDAFASYVAAAQKRPPIPDLYLRLGLQYLEHGDADRAISTLGLVEQLRSTSSYLIPRMHCALAEAYRRRGDLEQAREHLDSAPADCVIPGLSG